jgi:hypothetical protein
MNDEIKPSVNMPANDEIKPSVNIPSDRWAESNRELARKGAPVCASCGRLHLICHRDFRGYGRAGVRP